MKKKIIIYSSNFLSAKVFLEPQISKLETKYKIFLATNISGMKSVDRIKNINYLNLPFSRKPSSKDILLFFSILFLNFKHKFDYSITITPKAGLFGNLASFFFNLPVRVHIFTGQIWANKKGFFGKILFYIDKIISLISTHVMCDGISQKIFLKKNKLTVKKIFVIDKGSISGIDTRKYKKSKFVRSEIRKKLNIHGTLFMFAGRMCFDKGLDELIYAFSKLATQNKNVKLLLVGNDEGILEYLKNKYEIFKTNKIIMKEFSYDFDKYLKAADCFVLPSHREGFGVSLAQAMSCELVVIGSNIYGLKDLLSNGVNSFTFKSKNAEDLYKVMTKVLSLKYKTRKKIGHYNRLYILKYFKKQNVVKNYIKFFDKIFI